MVGLSKKEVRLKKILEYLDTNGRAKVMDMARDLDIPKSTVSDYIKHIERRYDFVMIKKDRF